VSEFYEDGQVTRILPYCPNKVDWFIIGGPADGNEAQIFKQHHPECRAIGFEPYTKFFEFQRFNDFPGQLINCALWSKEVQDLELRSNDNERGASLTKYETCRNLEKINASSLDNLSKIYGHFKNAVLWIYIEGSEVECLKGARRLLDSHEIKTINVEVMPETEDDIIAILMSYDYKYAHHWNERETHPGRMIYDMIFNITGERT
jgi:FkbM family methyltransferase